MRDFYRIFATGVARRPEMLTPRDTWSRSIRDLHTVNVVIFAGGIFRENVGKTFHVGVIFTILLLFLL